jgi:hypothetical protein
MSLIGDQQRTVVVHGNTGEAKDGCWPQHVDAFSGAGAIAFYLAPSRLCC